MRHAAAEQAVHVVLSAELNGGMAAVMASLSLRRLQVAAHARKRWLLLLSRQQLLATQYLLCRLARTVTVISQDLLGPGTCTRVFVGRRDGSGHIDPQIAQLMVVWESGRRPSSHMIN